MKRSARWIAALAALAFAFSTQDIAAKSLKAAVGFPKGNAVTQAVEAFADYVEENSDLRMRVFTMSLLSLKESGPGLRDGIADVAFILTAYFPAEYAETNLVANLSMMATSGERRPSPGMAMAGAVSEYVFSCPECQAEYKRQNQVYLGSAASPPYMMLCNSPLRTLDDLKGKRYRSGAANFSRWAEHFGGVAVSMPANDIYEAMGQGVVDCNMISATELSNLSLFDVTQYVVPAIPGGVFAGVATTNVNRDAWLDLSVEERQVMLKGAPHANSVGIWKYHVLAEENLALAAEKGIEVIDLPQDMLAASDDFVAQDITQVGREFTEAYGVDDAKTKIARFVGLLDKWKGLTEGLEDNPEALAQLYWDEIYSKVDAATYAME